MNGELRVLRKLVIWLWDSHQRPGKYIDRRANEIITRIGSSGLSIPTDTYLDNLLPTNEKVATKFPNRYFLYLNPVVDRHLFIPRIQLMCDFGRNIPEIRCRLEIYLIDDRDCLQALGYRFEAPEGVGVHHYYHIQNINPTGKLPTHRWLPESQPAFPLDANSPVLILVSLLVSLYGLDYLKKLQSVANSIDPHLVEILHRVEYRNIDDLEWYWIVVDSGNRLYYHTCENPSDFKHDFRISKPGCSFIGMTQEDFNALPDREKRDYKRVE